MNFLVIAVAVGIVLLLFGGFKSTGNARNVIWFLVVVLAVYLTTQLV